MENLGGITAFFPYLPLWVLEGGGGKQDYDCLTDEETEARDGAGRKQTEVSLVVGTNITEACAPDGSSRSLPLCRKEVQNGPPSNALSS